MHCNTCINIIPDEKLRDYIRDWRNNDPANAMRQVTKEKRRQARERLEESIDYLIR